MALGGYVYRAFRSNRRRNVLGIVAVVVTVALMVLVGVLFNTALGTITDLFTREIGYDLQVTQSMPGGFNITNVSYLEVDPVRRALLDGGAESAHAMVAQVMIGFEVTSSPESGTLLVLYGAEPGYDSGTVDSLDGKYDIEDGDCVLSREAAEFLEVGVGDRIQVVGYRGALNFTANLTELLKDPEFLERLIWENWTVAGVIEVHGRFLQGIGSYVVKDLATVQGLYNISGRATQVVGTVDPTLYDLNDPQDPAGEVLALAEGIALELGTDYVVMAPRAQAIEASMEAARATNVIAYLFSVVFPIISGIMIASILNLSVEERAKDMAIMRLLGARRRAIGRVVAGELALMLLVGIPLGVVLGIGGSIALGPTAQRIGSEFAPVDLDVVVDWGVVLGQVLITLAITSLFALAPLRKAMATSPAEAITQVRTEGRYRFVSVKGVDNRLLVGAFLLFAALLYATFFIPYFLIFQEDQFYTFFIFSFLVLLLSYCIWMLVAVPLAQRGVVGLMRPLLPGTHKLVRATLGRYVRRNASTSLIFTIIVAILLFFSTFFTAIFDSVDKQARYELGADLLVDGGEPLPEELYTGVAAANFTRHAAAATSTQDAWLSSVIYSRRQPVALMSYAGDLTRATFASEEDVWRGDLSTLRDLDPDQCVISQGLALELEVGLGDTVSLDTEEDRRFVRVALILQSMPGYSGYFPERPEFAAWSGVLVSLDTFADVMGVPREEVTYNRLFVMVEPGFDHEEVARTLQQRYRVFFQFSVLVTQVFIDQAEQGLAVLDFIFFVILVILMAVAFFSLYMNLLASVLEREFELGIVRSLGLRAGAMRNALVAEGTAVAVVAMVVGMVVGMTLSTLIISFFNMLSPIDFSYSVPWRTLGVLAAITLVLSVMATYPAARKVARRPVVELMRRAT